MKRQLACFALAVASEIFREISQTQEQDSSKKSIRYFRYAQPPVWHHANDHVDPTRVSRMIEKFNLVRISASR